MTCGNLKFTESDLQVSSIWMVSAFSFIMDGRLLFVVFIYSFHKIQTEVLPPPQLTVTPSVITETQTVTLKCQTESSVPVHQCYFYTVGRTNSRGSTCRQELTGTELLRMSEKSSPAEVEVKCYYTIKDHYRSPHSDSSSITILKLPPPQLTVTSRVITETETVTLNCQTPSFLAVHQCYVYTVGTENSKGFTCMQTLTGTELLRMSEQSSPAEVQVKCYYTQMFRGRNYPSQHSDTSSITILNLSPPQLTVTPRVITETQTVTLNCQTPSDVAVHQCYFFTVGRENYRPFTCTQTLTGTEMLRMSEQSSPADAEVRCFYTQLFGGRNYPSPYSDSSSITILNLQPQLTVTPSVITETQTVTLKCQTESHVPVHQCYFVIAERRLEDFTCEQKLTGTELLRMTKSSPAEVEVKCYYIMDHYGSPYSDSSSITILKSHTMQTKPTSTVTTGLTHIWPLASTTPVKQTSESHTMQTKPTSTVTTGLAVTRTHTSAPVTTVTSGWTVGALSKNSASLTSVKPTSGSSVPTSGTEDRAKPATSPIRMWQIVAVLSGGVTAGIILLVSAMVLKKRRTGSEEVKRSSNAHNDNEDTYHVYATTSEEPSVSVQKNAVYSTVQPH